MMRKRTLAVAVVGAAALIAATLLSLAGEGGAGDAAGKALSFSDAPSGWSVTVGQKDNNVGTVTATGVAAKRIRYSLSGPDGFAIKARSGRVRYDGSALTGSTASLTITARERSDKAGPATITVSVAVAGGSQPVIQEPEPETPVPSAEDDKGLPGHSTPNRDEVSAREKPRSHMHTCKNPTGNVDYRGEKLEGTPYDGQTYGASHIGKISGDTHAGPKKVLKQGDNHICQKVGWIPVYDHTGKLLYRTANHGGSAKRAQHIKTWRADVDRMLAFRAKITAWWKDGARTHFHKTDDGDTVRHKVTDPSDWHQASNNPSIDDSSDLPCHEHTNMSKAIIGGALGTGPDASGTCGGTSKDHP